MFTLAAFAGTLPPASLAKADLPDFVSRALRRRLSKELAELRTMLAHDTLSGYPSSLGPVLGAVIEGMDTARLQPADLDPATARHLMSSPDFIRSVAGRVEVDRVILRPGTPVIGEVRVLLDGRVVTLRGEGSQMVLLGPVELIRLHGLGWTGLRSVPLARLMDTDEAGRIRDLWARIEEQVSWPSDVGRYWEARFVEVAARPNDRVDLCVDWLRDLTPLQRREVWRELLEHLRDQELPESHRPFQRALSGRLEALGLDVPAEVLVALSSIGLAAYESCAHDPWVERGYCSCIQPDIDRYAEWVEVPSGTRQRLQALDPAVIIHHLRTLAAAEEGLLRADLDTDVARDLRGFRDAYLCVRYRRDVSSILGTDPLTLAEERLQQGCDKGRLLEDLEQLADSVFTEVEVSTLVPPLPSPAPVAPREYHGADPDAEATSTRRRSRPLRPEAYPVTTPDTDLPPLPRPPPPPVRPTTRRRMELPPLPDVPPARPPSRVIEERATPERPPEPAPPPPVREVAAAPRERVPTSPYLVTPNQGARFYETAFHELQVLERDLLERGAWPEAEARIRDLANEAEELATALGPSARSGDAVFQKALHKVELVRAYLERIKPLTEASPGAGPPPAAPGPDDDGEDGVMNRLGRLLRGDD